MRFDVRLPIGLLFLCLGLLVGSYGALGGAAAVKPGEPNIDLIGGAAMAAFGGLMVILTRLHRDSR